MTEPLRTPFGFSSTADEVIDGVDLSGRRALVTGAGSGIGTETARALASAGAEVVLAVRRPDAGERTAGQLREETGNPHVSAAELDLADLGSVAAFATSWAGPLHILVNNAGVMALPQREVTPEGHEMQFAVNHLGHFALTTALHASLTAAGGARVVCVSSSAHLLAPVDFEDIDFAQRPYDPWTAYGQSKTAQVLLAVGITRHWGHEGIHANALNPGAIPTNLQRHTGGLRTPVERRKSVAQGAATSVLLAASPLVEGVGGRYFEDCAEAAVVRGRLDPAAGGVAPYALDAEAAERLWERAESFVG
ncbi:SDR family NAD(P)-dependent oxidoreductase [Streptomyces sp. NPDC059740]|uniref:SDR family NAD(P)-dependent oxidoreductase n=1 Tax=Streptomyces sp. NPDC059740 TaxID=3346926 RepID=UPI0036660A05